MTAPSLTDGTAGGSRHLARIVLLVFVLTFMTSRMVTYLIMSRRMPDLYVHLGGTHIHHMNYGIFLLSGVGAYLLFATPSPRARTRAGVFYGLGLALTFDEFGMWLHLGGGYWQRASFDAIVVVAGLLGMAAFAPPLRTWRRSHVAAALVTCAWVVVFGLLLAESFRFAAAEQPRFERLDRTGPR
jgi:hypothetical protein